MKINQKVRLALRSILLKAGAVETDKATLLYDAENLEVGTEVFVENAEGEIVPAEDGEYVAGDTTYVVSEGKVSEIRKDEETEIVETDEENPEAEPADSEPETEHAPSIEERVAALEQAVGDIRDGIEQLTNAIAAVAERLAAIEEKVRGLDEPAAEPAEEGEETEQKFTSRMQYLRRK